MLRLVAFAFLLAPLLAAQSGGTIEGVVVGTVTGAGIQGVNVTVFTRQAVRYETTTDDTGSFHVTGMAPGAYEVRLEKETYTAGHYDPPQPYRVAAGQDAVRIRLEMTKLAAISGRVVDGDGRPVPGAQVKLDGGFGVATTQDGTFTIKPIPPGFHTLLAVPPAKAGAAATQDQVRIEPAPTYFPSTTDPAAAQRILVRDADLADYEIRLQTAVVHRVRGVVLSETAKPVSRATLRLFPVVRQDTRVVLNVNGSYLTMLGPGFGLGPEEANFTTGADGAFEFASVRAGEWRIKATYGGQLDSGALVNVRSGTLPVLVGRGDLENLELRMGAPFALSGTSDWSGLPARQTMVNLVGVEGGLSLPGNMVGEPNGSFRIGQLQPGRYYLAPLFTAGFYPASVLLDGREVLGQPVDLLGGSPALKLVYKQAQASYVGRWSKAPPSCY